MHLYNLKEKNIIKVSKHDEMVAMSSLREGVSRCESSSLSACKLIIHVKVIIFRIIIYFI